MITIIKNRVYLEVMQLKSIFILLNDQHCHRVDSKEGGGISHNSTGYKVLFINII